MYLKLSKTPVWNFLLLVFFSVSKGFNAKYHGVSGVFERFLEPVLIACGYWVIFIEIAHRESSDKAPIFLASIIGWLCLSKVSVRGCANPSRLMIPCNSLKYLLYLSFEIAIAELLNIVIPFFVLLTLWVVLFGESSAWFFQYAFAVVIYSLFLTLFVILLSRMSQWLAIVIRFAARFGLFLTGILFQMPLELSGVVSAFAYFHPFDELLFTDDAGFYAGLSEDLLVLAVLIAFLLIIYNRMFGSKSKINIVGCLDGVKKGFTVKMVSKDRGVGAFEKLGIYYSLGRKLNPRFDWCDNNVLISRLCTELQSNTGCSNTKIAYMKSSLESMKKKRVRLLVDDQDDLWKSGLIGREILDNRDPGLFYIVESEDNVSKD